MFCFSRGGPSHLFFFSYQVEKEALVLIWTLQHFEVYVGTVCNTIVVYTDHNPLPFLHSLQNTNHSVMRWWLIEPYFMGGVLMAWEPWVLHVCFSLSVLIVLACYRSSCARGGRDGYKGSSYTVPLCSPFWLSAGDWLAKWVIFMVTALFCYLVIYSYQHSDRTFTFLFDITLFSGRGLQVEISANALFLCGCMDNTAHCPCLK